MAASGLHISIVAEPVTHIGSFVITNSMLTSVLVSTALITFAVIVNLSLDTKTTRPKGLQNFAEMIIESLEALINSVAGSQNKTRAFFPLIASFLLYILINNWFGLVPGVGTIGYMHKVDGTKQHAVLAPSEQKLNVGSQVQAVVADNEATSSNQDSSSVEAAVMEAVDAHNSEKGEYAAEEAGYEKAKETFVPYFRPGTADLNGTLALGIISVLATQFFGVRYLSLGYFKKFINFSNPIMFFVGILELVSEFAKIISFAFRLFGNIFAGEVLLVVISFLVPLIVPMPFYGLEIFVGFIQALVFAMLSLVFFNMATESHEDH